MLAYLKFRFARSSRLWRRRFKRFQIQLREYLQLHIWGKWRQLGIIRRFVLVWWGLMLMGLVLTLVQIQSLNRYYEVAGPAPGGVFSEGLIGTIRNINPILPEGEASQDVAKLVFSGLTRITPDRGIEGDLAESWAVSSDSKTYTFKLRKGVTWHDGVPFTARDVRFTLAAIQNPDTRSPLASSWQGVKVEAPDEHTVVFTLPNVNAPFIYSTTFGILPSHKLETLEPSVLRVSEFNQRPVGTGPFKVQAFIPGKNEIQLERNENYHYGSPLLEEFVFRLYENTSQALEAYAKREISAVGRLTSSQIMGGDTAMMKPHEMSLPNQVGVFFKTTSPLLKEVPVRRALAAAVDRQALVASLEDARAIKLPLLPGQVGYTTKYQVPDYNIQKAKAELEAAGWKLQNGVRKKGTQELKISLVTADTGNYPRLAEALARSWKEVGVMVEVKKTDARDLQQSHIRPRNYDALLYGISLDADPDVYAYWHSSQKDDPGLNVSQYVSATADRNLEAGRLSVDSRLRNVKYNGFLEAWVADVPAVILYQPTYVYGTGYNVLGVVADKLVRPSDRFYGVEKWSVNTQPAQRPAVAR